MFHYNKTKFRDIDIIISIQLNKSCMHDVWQAISINNL